MGYDKQRFVEEIPEAFLCSICLDVLKEARTCSNCEGVICLQCLQKCQLRKPEICPISNCQNSNFLRLHAILRNQLLKFKLRCQNFNMGCQQTIRIENLLEHEQVCEFNQITCQNCEISLSANDFKSHNCIEYLRTFTSELQEKLNDYCNQSSQNQEFLTQTQHIEEHYKSILFENQQFVKRNKQLEQQCESLKKENADLKDKVKQQVGEIQRQTIKLNTLRVSNGDIEDKIESKQFPLTKIKCTSARLPSNIQQLQLSPNNQLYQFQVNKSQQQNLQLSSNLKIFKKQNSLSSQQIQSVRSSKEKYNSQRDKQVFKQLKQEGFCQIFQKETILQEIQQNKGDLAKIKKSLQEKFKLMKKK